MQSKKMSAMEAGANLVLGYIISVLLLYAIMPLYGYYPDFSTSNQMVLWFTIASFLRSYGLRRLFNLKDKIKKDMNVNTAKVNIDSVDKNIELVKIDKELNKYVITIYLTEKNRSLGFFFIDRVRELFGINYELKIEESNKIVISINTSTNTSHMIIKYQELIDAVLNSGCKSYEELIIKSFNLNLSPK